MKGTHYVDNTANLTPEAKEFIRRLRQEMANRDWNGAEVARQAALHMPDGTFGRDLITRYKRGAKPRDAHLIALAAALNLQPQDLYPGFWNPLMSKGGTAPSPMPRRAAPVQETPPPANALEILPNGRARLRVDREFNDPAEAIKWFQTLMAGVGAPESHTEET